MIGATFKSGNYNQWENLVNEILPNKNITFRQEVIPLIDKILLSMLGENSLIEKSKVNVKQLCNNKKGLESLLYMIEYQIQDFLVEGINNKAVEKDENAIRNAIFIKGFHLKDIKINTNKGTLYLEFETFLED